MSDAMRALLGYLRPYRRTVALLLVGLLVELGWAVAFGMSFQFILDEAIADVPAVLPVRRRPLGDVRHCAPPSAAVRR